MNSNARFGSSASKRHAAWIAIATTALAIALFVASSCTASPPTERGTDARAADRRAASRRVPVELGARPMALLDQLRPGPLRDQLEACRDRTTRLSRFSIGHRGAPLGYPEHTIESYLAAARMGAGTIECDVTFTSDRTLVCRHAQCDLATTTNILETPLAERCSEPFQPARIDPETGALLSPAQAKCCTSDLTLAEFRTLEGRMDWGNPHATRPEDFDDTSGSWRSPFQVGDGRGTLVTHAESIALFDALGVAMMPELKTPQVVMPFDGDYTRDRYAHELIDAYREAKIESDRVFPQSFDLADIHRWLEYAPEYGAQAVLLDGRDPREDAPSEAEFEALAASGLTTLAPPISTLLRLDGQKRIVATDYARRARAAGFDLVAWSLERSGPIRSGQINGRRDDFYLGPLLPALQNDGDLYRVLDALHREVGVRSVFSDWPAAVTYYANCLALD